MSEYLVKTPDGSKIRCAISDKAEVGFNSFSLGNCHFGGNTGPMYENTKRPNNKDQYYVGAFYITWFIPTINQIYANVTGMLSPFPLFCLSMVFIPLQGVSIF